MARAEVSVNKAEAPSEENAEVKALDTKQKAAIVVVSLGADRASQIYKYLNEQDIEDLTFEVARMGKTTNAQVESSLDEFYKLCLTHKMMTDGGLDYARDVLEKAFGETTARSLLEKVSKTLQGAGDCPDHGLHGSGAGGQGAGTAPGCQAYSNR